MSNTKKHAKRVFGFLLLCVGLGCAMSGLCLLGFPDAVDTMGTALQLQGLKVVIDAGHGGSDGGAEGYQTSVKESELNLDIALKLRDALTAQGAEVVMTREDAEAVADTKQDDMRVRREIIQGAGQDITISIHQNSFPDHSVSGPQVMYAPGSEEGEALAACIQACLVEQLDPPKIRVVLPGDYYIVNSGTAPAVLIECGFLSNAREEALLVQEEYREKIVRAIVLGVEQYFSASD